MQKIILLLILITCHLSAITPLLTAQNPTWEWVTQLGDQSNESIKAMVIDDDGNFHLAGNFSNQFQIADTTLEAQGNTDFYLLKLDKNRNLLWAVQGGGAFADLVEDIQVDDLGNIYCVGSFFVNATFEDTLLVDSKNSKAIFILKYSPFGKLIWAKQIEGTSFKIASALAIDQDSNIVLTGYFEDSLKIADTTLATNGFADMYVSKLSANGEMLWVNSIGMSGEFKPVDVDIDTENRIIVAGDFQGEAIFNQDTIKANTADHDVFVAKFDESGNPLWARKAGGVYEDGCGALALDDADHIYVTGRFLAVMKLSDSIEIQTEGFNENLYLLKYDTAGLALYAHSFGNKDLDESGTDISITQQIVYITGTFQQEMTIGQYSISGGAGVFNGFTAAFDLDGEAKWARALTCDNILLPEQLSTLGDHLFVTGNFMGTAQFDETTLESTTNFDIFLSQFNNILTPTIEIDPAIDLFTIFPNPTDQWVHIRSESELTDYKVTLFNLQGQSLLRESNAERLAVSHLPKGVYLLRITDRKGIRLATKKLIIK